MGLRWWLGLSVVLACVTACKGDGDLRRPIVPLRYNPVSHAGGTAADSAGTGGSTPSVVEAGSGGRGTMIGIAGSTVMPPQAGTSTPATGGSGGAQPPDGSLTYDTCIEGLRMGGQPITECEMCMCQESGCLSHIDQMREDQAGTEMIACVLENQCDQQCCLCGAKCGLTNYGKGPCAPEIERAAGLTPGAGLSNVSGIMRYCVPDGPADNSCAKATRLGVCIAEKCASMCNVPPTCM
jgi:hypothetical protein